MQGNAEKGMTDIVRSDEKIKEKLRKIDNKLAVLSGKGGVGKTTVAVNLALALSLEGKQVGVLDVDITGPNVPKMLGMEEARLGGKGNEIVPASVSENLKVVSMAFLLEREDTPVIWRGPMKMQAIRQFLGVVAWGDLDYLIIDLPPGTGDEALSVAQLIPGDARSVVVTTPQDVALLDSRKAVNFSKQVGMKVMGIVENMSGFKCPHCGGTIDLFKTGGGRKAAAELDVEFLGGVPIDPEIVATADRGVPFVSEHKDGDSAASFMKIVEKIRYFEK